MAKLNTATDDQEKREEDHLDQGNPEHVTERLHLYQLHRAHKNDQHVDYDGYSTETSHGLSVFLSVTPVSFEHIEGVEVRVVRLVALESTHA